MHLIERYSLPMFLLLCVTDNGPISLFLSTVLTPRRGKGVTLLLHYAGLIAAGLIAGSLPLQVGSPFLYTFQFIVTYFCYRDSIPRKLLAQGICIVGLMFCQLVAGGVFEAAGYRLAEVIANPGRHLLVLLVGYLLYYPYLFLFSRFLHQKFPHSKGMIYFALIPVCELIPLGGLVGCFLYTGNLFYLIVLTLSAGVSFVSLFFLFQGMRRVVESAQTETRYTWLQAQQKLQADYSAVLEEQLHEARKLRHDFLNYTHTLDLLLASGHYQDVESCTQRLRDDIAAAPQVQYCTHPVVNAILYYKLAQAQAQKINTQVRLALSSECGVEAADLIGLFSNLLDNAIEACADVEDNPWLTLADRHSGYLYTITVRNSKSQSSMQLVDGKPVTRKPDWKHHGLGLEILEEIAQRYHGAISVRDEGGSFVTCVLLQLEMEAPCQEENKDNICNS